MSRTFFARLALVAALAISANLAEAGRSCEQRPPTADAVTRAMTLA